MDEQNAIDATSLPSKRQIPINLTDNINIKHLEKVWAMKPTFNEVGKDSFEALTLVDAVQRLGVDYYFQDEIEEILQRQYTIAISNNRHDHPDLREIALRFRLLRQEGYNVSTDIFNKFLNKEGEFNQKVIREDDIDGLMSLYEASHLSTKGEEDVLEDAKDFSSKFLNECLKNLIYHQSELVKNTLRYPYHKSLAKFIAKSSVSNNSPHENEWVHVLHQMAKSNSSIVKSLHQNEIIQVSKWWKDLGLAKKLSFARDQPLKWYIWSMATITDPSLSEERVDLTKPISLIYIIDDIYDVYGTLHELSFFTQTIHRWDLTAMDRLPSYMKTCFKALDDITNEISNKVYKKHGYNPLYSLRKAPVQPSVFCHFRSRSPLDRVQIFGAASTHPGLRFGRWDRVLDVWRVLSKFGHLLVLWSNLCNAFLVEAEWFASCHLPSSEEYLKNGIVSSGVHVGLVHIFFLLGGCITRETVELIDNFPPLISSTATILRLFDDLGSAKDENQDGKDGSYVQYYMNEHQDYTADVAIKHVIDKISDAWKDLNKECLHPNPFSKPFTRACLNVARMVPLMYDYDENQRLPGLEDYIKSILFEAVPTRGVYD